MLQFIEETPSTHNLLKADPQAYAPGLMIAARRQTAGRGQRGNSWESEDGKNLCFSMIWKPCGIAPAEQFSISEATALAIAELLGSYHIVAKVKWPNDIYVGDKKICGILIDHSLMGSSICHSIISAGLNVNQTIFRSDAPNPISMALAVAGDESAAIPANAAGHVHTPMQVEGHPRFNIDEIAGQLHEILLRNLKTAESPEGRAALHAAFMKELYRGAGFHPFFDVIKGEHIEARIAGIAPTGTLTLQLRNGETRSYAFKELSFSISNC